VSALREYSSPLSHFEPTELLDTLSTGIVVLDGHLCPIYANDSAQDLMAVSLKQARGRPFADLFFDPRQLVSVLRRSLDGLETCTQHEISLKARYLTRFPRHHAAASDLPEADRSRADASISPVTATLAAESFA